MVFFFLQYLLEKEGGGHVFFLERHLYYLFVEIDSIGFILNILFYHLLEAGTHHDRKAFSPVYAWESLIGARRQTTTIISSSKPELFTIPRPSISDYYY